MTRKSSQKQNVGEHWLEMEGVQRDAGDVGGSADSAAATRGRVCDWDVGGHSAVPVAAACTWFGYGLDRWGGFGYEASEKEVNAWRIIFLATTCQIYKPPPFHQHRHRSFLQSLPPPPPPKLLLTPLWAAVTSHNSDSSQPPQSPYFRALHD